MKRPEDIIGDQILKLCHFALSKFVKPDLVVDKVTDIDVEELERIKEKYGIEAIILDVDDTLRTDMESIPEVNKKWIETLNKKVKLIILSNGLDRNVEEYFKENGIEYIGMAFKPFKRNFVKACMKMDVKPEKVMVIGDSLFDDIHGGKRNKMKTVLVKNVDSREEK